MIFFKKHPLSIFNRKTRFLAIFTVFSIVFSLKTHAQTGLACIYSQNLHGRKTASGERFDKNKLTAAHLKFKLGTKVRVTNLTTKKSVVVRINDRGPFTKKFLIDLSPAAAKAIGFSFRQGVAKVRVERI